MESSESKSEMKEINVRLWGSGVGVGTTTRKIALVPAGFMAVRDPNQLQKPPSKASSPKKRKHSDQQDEKESVPDTDEQSSADVLVTIDFDSETGVGIRPEFSLLRLPRNAPSSQDTVLSAELTNAAENRSDASSTKGIKNEMMETTAPSSSMQCDTLDHFWKSIEDGNYFQPFSTKSHHLEDLCIRGGDYAELSAVLPLGNTAGPFTSTVSTSSGNNTMVTNGTSNSHGDTSNGIITGIVSDGSNGFDITCQLPPNATTTEKTGEKMSYEDDMTNILYERLLLSIVKLEDTSNVESTAGSGVVSSSSQEMVTDGKEITSDGNGKKRKGAGAKEKKTTTKGRKSNTKGGDDSNREINGHVNNGDSEVDSVSMSSGTFLSIKSDSLDFDGIEASVSASMEHTQNGNSNQCNKRKNGIISHSSSANGMMMNGLNATTTNTSSSSSSSAPISSSSSSLSLIPPAASSSSSASAAASSSFSSATMKTFGRGHRTIVELAEFGLINGGNIQGLGLDLQGSGLNQSHSNDRYSHNSYMPRLSPKGPTTSGIIGQSDSNNHNNSMSINTAHHGSSSSICGYLKEQMTTYWTDDELGIAHRETVKLLEETEKQLNERIVNLRQFMSHPEVHQEESNRKRQNELHRSVIGRLGKFRKKERLQAQLAHKVQQRQKSREKKGGGSSESGGES